jgi:hypothetical protein
MPLIAPSSLLLITRTTLFETLSNSFAGSRADAYVLAMNKEAKKIKQSRPEKGNILMVT